MPRCKIFLFTYNRNDLLPRAVKHLIGQTFKDWICEVHNDNPENTFPEEFIKSLEDTRFLVNNHKINLGGTESFNLAFDESDWEYVSILEDDNWWEPEFLFEMIASLDREPNIDIVWSDMKVWKETSTSQWENTGKTIWNEEREDLIFTWPNYKQAIGALHSNGAMLFRGKNSKSYLIPAQTEFGIIEAVRERTFKFPIYLLNKPYANFSLTLQTSRSKSAMIWAGSQIMLLGSFINGAGEKEKIFEDTLSYYRKTSPAHAATFFLTLVFEIKEKRFLRYFQFSDWLIISRWVVRHIFDFSKLHRYLVSNREVYNFLLINTKKQNGQVSEL